MIRVSPTRTTGQYIYIALTVKKLSHINRPRRKRKKHGIYCALDKLMPNIGFAYL